MKLCLLLSLAVGAFCASIDSEKNVPGDTIQDVEGTKPVRQKRSTEGGTSTTSDACDNSKTALNDAENLETVVLHNRYRTKESAADELKLSYDMKLANRAQQLAKRCVWEHGLTTDCEGNTIGQNMYMSGGGPAMPALNLTGYIFAWYDEKENYDAATKLCASGKKCGHYKQVAWAQTGQVGCGYSKCASVAVKGSPAPWTNAIVFVCNYAPAGNYPKKPVNTEGNACSLCTKVVKNGFKCVGGLCAPCIPALEKAGDVNKCTCEVRKCVQGTWSAPDCACKCNEGYTGTLCDKQSGCKDAYEGGVCAGWKGFCTDAAYKAFMTTTCPKTCNFC